MYPLAPSRLANSCERTYISAIFFISHSHTHTHALLPSRRSYTWLLSRKDALLYERALTTHQGACNAPERPKASPQELGVGRGVSAWLSRSPTRDFCQKRKNKGASGNELFLYILKEQKEKKNLRSVPVDDNVHLFSDPRLKCKNYTDDDV